MLILLLFKVFSLFKLMLFSFLFNIPFIIRESPTFAVIKLLWVIKIEAQVEPEKLISISELLVNFIEVYRKESLKHLTNKEVSLRILLSINFFFNSLIKFLGNSSLINSLTKWPFSPWPSQTPIKVES